MGLDLASRLARAEAALVVLAEYRELLPTAAAYSADPRGRDIVERNVQIAVQAAIDLADDLIATRGWGRPVSATAAAGILGAKRILTPALADAFTRWIRMRNVVVHEYASVDDRRIHQALGRRLRELRQILAALARAHGLA